MIPHEGLRLGEIAARLGERLEGDDTVVISQVATLISARSGQIAFLANPKYRGQLRQTRASAVIVPPSFAGDTDLPKIVSPNAYACYARVATLLNPPRTRPAGVHASAVVHGVVSETARIGENVVIGQNATIGENVTLYPGCVIGDGVSIGADSVLYPNVVVYHDCIIGCRAIVHSGAVIGSDGFGFAKDGERWVKIPQIGRVVIGDDVEIGANTSIDRGALDDTVIGNGVKLDNQIQVAHNVTIGEHTAMAGCAGIAGSTRIGRRCTIGGAASISGHLELADDVHISGATTVSKNLNQPGQYTSVFPLEAHGDWLKNAAQIRHLARLSKRVSELEKKLVEKSS